MSSFSQLLRVDGTIPSEQLKEGIGQLTVYTLPDSNLIKGSYLDSSYFSIAFDPKDHSDFYIKIKIIGFADTTLQFTKTDTVVHLGVILLEQSKNLKEVEIFYREPMYERTMDGIKVNVEGTNLQTLTNLFEVLKASPKLTSPDDENIEIIGKGQPLILIDRQAVISNDELKAIPANMIDRIEIITNPSAKYRAQGRGSGVIEVYTKDFHLEGYNMTVSTSGGMNTQLQPKGRLSLGLSLKKNKFSLNAYAGINYDEQITFGSGEGVMQDGSDRTRQTTFENEGWRSWQHANIKSAYQINEDHKITAGLRSSGSLSGAENHSTAAYYEEGVLVTQNDQITENKRVWINNSAFLNYQWETDTFHSVLEVNVNYVLKISDAQSEYESDFENVLTSSSAVFARQNSSKDRPNVGEFRANYEHVFDTSGWKLSGGFSYNMLYNGKSFDQYIRESGSWVIDPAFSNSYDYQEHIGTVFIEGSKKWNKFGIRAGLSGEYTNLYGYSNSLDKKFMDSTYFLPFPSVSVMFEPAKKVAVSLNYSSGISRPQFSNYDPFVRIEDSLSIQYGNPFLQPSISHSVGFDLDLFYAYSISVNYRFVDQPISSLSFVDDATFLINSTPWNADQSQSISVSLNLPIRLKWLNGWNSIWFNYNKHEFTPEFERSPFFNITYGLWSGLNFTLPRDFQIGSRLFISKWGSDSFTGNTRVSWGLKLTKRMMDNNLQLHIDVSEIIAPISRNENFSGNYQTSTVAQTQFTSFKLGIFVKFGRLKRAANIKESESGQSDRI